MELSLRVLDCEFDNAAYRPLLLNDACHVTKSLKKRPIAEIITRKFIVLKSDKKMYLVIGPVVAGSRDDPKHYFHKDLRAITLSILDKAGDTGCQISGGGQFDLRYDFDMRGWYVEWGGHSSDYGIYDPAVLGYTKEIVNWFGIPVIFYWRDTLYPPKQ